MNHSPGTPLSNHSTPTRGGRTSNSNHQPMVGTPNSSQIMGRESLPPPPPPPASATDGVDRYSGYGSHLPNPPYISSVMVNSGSSGMGLGTPPPPPPPPLPPPGGVSYGLMLPPIGREARGSSSESELPLPPPPPLPDTAPPDMRMGGSSSMASAAPPPPPPPPMPAMSPPRDNGRVIVTNGDISKVSNSASPPKGSPGAFLSFKFFSPKNYNFSYFKFRSRNGRTVIVTNDTADQTRTSDSRSGTRRTERLAQSHSRW